MMKGFFLFSSCLSKIHTASCDEFSFCFRSAVCKNVDLETKFKYHATRPCGV